MSSKYINNHSYATSGYVLSGEYQSIIVGSAGIIGGSNGLFGGYKQAYTIVNAGSISGGGVSLQDGGTVTNTGHIEGDNGDNGVDLDAVGIVSNSGTIIANFYGSGIVLLTGGIVINSSSHSVIEGYVGVTAGADAGTISNSGTIIGVHYGIYLRDGGIVNNAASGLIIRPVVIDGNGTVTNAGSISNPIKITESGAIENTGSISGVDLESNGTVKNMGEIGYVFLKQFGSITNIGSAADISSIVLGDGGSVNNAGTVGGINLSSGGTVTNTASGVIAGSGYEITVLSSFGVVTNAGTIGGAIDLPSYGVTMNKGGTVGNGAHSLIEAYVAVDLSGGIDTVENAGTIRGGTKLNPGTGQAAGIRIAQGNVTNSSGGIIEGLDAINGSVASVTIVNDSGALIAGSQIGIMSDGGTVDNFGTISGQEAISLANAGVVIDHAGSVFIGKVIGGGGTLELAGAAGTLNGLGTNFSGFAIANVLAGGAWDLTGTNILVSGTTSSTVDSGLLMVTGTATIAGTVSGAGTLTLAGTETLTTGAVLSVSHLVQSGGSVIVGKNLTYNGTFAQTAGPIKVTGDTLVLKGADNLSNGAISGTGFLATYGAVSLVNYTINGGAVWQVYGKTTATASVTLGNGGGGSGRLAIEAGGAYDITGDGGIVVAPGGSGTVGNFALFEKTAGTGISTIAAAFTNSGTVAVTSGALDLAGAVSGTGSATIGSAGVLRFDSSVAATQTIVFAGTTGGRLALNDPAGDGLGFAGIVKGFGGKDQLDLTSFAFNGDPTIGWSQTSSGSGTLTVTDASKIAKITLFGQYSQAGFGKIKDGGTGTDITYTTPSQVVIASPHH